MQLHFVRFLRTVASIAFLVELFLFPRAALSLDCNALPLAVPITNTTLSTGFQRRGLPISIGTPPQNFSLKVLAAFNNTIFKEGPITDDNCDKSQNSAARCIIVKGGVYDRGRSSTWSGHMNKEEFEGAPETRRNIDIVGEETIQLPGLELDSFPIGIENGAEIGTSGLGLGLNSSLLNSLLAAGKIPSRVWGLDWGWTGDSDKTWRDGSLVLGGYDKSRIKDNKLFTQDFSPDSSDPDGCAMLVFITGISMKNDTNELQLLDSRGESIRACVSPDYDLMTLPSPVFNKFNDAMGGIYSKRSVGDFYLWGYESDVKSGYKGSMTIKLSNGFSTTIPNHQLIQPYRDYDPNGKPVVKDSTTNVLRLNSLEEINARDLPLLGLTFLSSSYLVFDPDQKQFQLGESIRSEGEALVPGALTQCTEDLDGSPTTTEDIKATTTPQKPPPPTPKQSSPSKIIIGTVVAGVVALAAVAAFLILRRRSKKQNERSGEGPELVLPIANEATPYELKAMTHELSGYSEPIIHEADSNPTIYEADSNPVQSSMNGRSDQSLLG